MDTKHEAMLERLRAYEGRFRIITGMNGLDSEILLGSFPELHSNGSPAAMHFNITQKDGKVCVSDLILPDGIVVPLLELNSNDFIATPPEARMTAGVVSVAHPPLDYWNNLYYDSAEVSDDVLDGIVAHEIGHYLDMKNQVPGKVNYILRRRGGLQDKWHVHAAIDIIGSYVVSRHAICSMFEYLRSHQPDSVELDVRTKQVELYGFK